MNYKSLESIEFSITDLRKILGKSFKLVMYPDLAGYNDINQILSQQNDYFVLYFETTSKTQGHYECIFRYGNNYHFWDSYGLGVSDDKKYIEKATLIKLNEFKPYLPDLINKSVANGDKWDYNLIDYQSWKNDVATCGRHVCTRILNRHLTEKQYYDYLLQYIKQNNLHNFDEAVTKITSKMVYKK